MPSRDSMAYLVNYYYAQVLEWNPVCWSDICKKKRKKEDKEIEVPLFSVFSLRWQNKIPQCGNYKNLLSPPISSHKNYVKSTFSYYITLQTVFTNFIFFSNESKFHVFPHCAQTLFILSSSVLVVVAFTFAGFELWGQREDSLVLHTKFGIQFCQNEDLRPPVLCVWRSLL